MRECDNSKIHISSNFLLSICLLIMLDTLLLVPSLHCNTSLHFTKLHLSTIHFLSFTLHLRREDYTQISRELNFGHYHYFGYSYPFQIPAYEIICDANALIYFLKKCHSHGYKYNLG
jgi:hypothetical protein